MPFSWISQRIVLFSFPAPPDVYHVGYVGMYIHLHFRFLLAKPGLATESCAAPNQNTAHKPFQSPQQLLENGKT